MSSHLNVARRVEFYQRLCGSKRIGSASGRRIASSVLPYVTHKASFSRFKSLLRLLENTKVLESVKSALGVSSLQEIPSKLKSLSSLAKKYVHDILVGWKSVFPLSLYFDGKKKMPSLTDVLARIISKSPKMKALIARAKTGVDVVDAFFKKHLPTLGKPLLAAIYIYVWLNVTELSWDLESVLKGFTGRISLGELFSSLPESGIGALVGLTGVGTFYFVPITIMARILWLVGNHYLEWTGSGFIIRWDRMGVPEKNEFVGV